jgi:hypothetical protein
VTCTAGARLGPHCRGALLPESPRRSESADWWRSTPRHEHWPSGRHEHWPFGMSGGSLLDRLPLKPSATMYRAERLVRSDSRCPIPSKPPNSRNHNNPRRTPGPTHTGRNTTFLEEYSNSPASLSGWVNKPEVAQLQSPAFNGGTIRARHNDCALAVLGVCFNPSPTCLT